MWFAWIIIGFLMICLLFPIMIDIMDELDDMLPVSPSIPLVSWIPPMWIMTFLIVAILGLALQVMRSAGRGGKKR